METEQKAVALIDDDPLVRKAIKRYLRGAGFLVQTYATPDEFLSAAASATAHCLVLDVDLGTSSGIDLARHPLVTALQVPIVMMSGAADDAGYRAEAEALGCVAYLRKPFAPPLLLDAIAKALNRSS